MWCFKLELFHIAEFLQFKIYITDLQHQAAKITVLKYHHFFSSFALKLLILNYHFYWRDLNFEEFFTVYDRFLEIQVIQRGGQYLITSALPPRFICVYALSGNKQIQMIYTLSQVRPPPYRYFKSKKYNFVHFKINSGSKFCGNKIQK